MYLFQITNLNTNMYSPDSGGIVWDRFSIQYLSIIMIIIIFPTFFIKEFKIISKLAYIGVIAIVTYAGFIIYIFVN